MAAIDTNVLVRLVTKDDESQYKKAQAFVEKHQPVLVTQLSVLELVWVLMSRYNLNKDRTCRVVEALLETRDIHLKAHSAPSTRLCRRTGRGALRSAAIGCLRFR